MAKTRTVASTPGAPTAPNPTLEHISIEWPMSGDTDLDGVVTVRFREVGGAYRQGLPLFHVPASSNEGFTWTHRHAGSLFGLTPDTTYDIELTLTDRDGGGTTTTLIAHASAVRCVGHVASRGCDARDARGRARPVEAPFPVITCARGVRRTAVRRVPSPRHSYRAMQRVGARARSGRL